MIVSYVVFWANLSPAKILSVTAHDISFVLQYRYSVYHALLVKSQMVLLKQLYIITQCC